MLFMTYKPKTARSVKAERITTKNIAEISATFFGSAAVISTEDSLSLKIATFEGVIEAEVGDWVVRTDEGVKKMSDKEFNETYEKARSGRDS